MEQKVKLAHSDSPAGLQKAIDELLDKYKGWNIVKTNLSTYLYNFTALILLEK